MGEDGRQRGFFVSFAYTNDSKDECLAFFRRTDCPASYGTGDLGRGARVKDVRILNWNAVMTTKTTDPELETKVFYHALYHHLAHWAAYVAMIGFLITTGVVLCVTTFPTTGNTRMRYAGIGFAILAAMFAAFHFVKGMDTYGSIVNNKIPKEYLGQIQKPQRKWMIWGRLVEANLSDSSRKRFQHKLMIWVLLVAAVACASVDLLILALVK